MRHSALTGNYGRHGRSSFERELMASRRSSFYQKSCLHTLLPLSNAPMFYSLKTKPVLNSTRAVILHGVTFLGRLTILTSVTSMEEQVGGVGRKEGGLIKFFFRRAGHVAFYPSIEKSVGNFFLSCVLHRVTHSAN